MDEDQASEAPGQREFQVEGGSFGNGSLDCLSYMARLQPPLKHWWIVLWLAQ